MHSGFAILVMTATLTPHADAFVNGMRMASGTGFAPVAIGANTKLLEFDVVRSRLALFV